MKLEYSKPSYTLHPVPTIVNYFPMLLTATFPTFSLVKYFKAGVSNLLASLGHTGKRGVVLGYTVNTLRHVITKKIS